MKLKPAIVDLASTDTLRTIADDFELDVADRRKRDDLEAAVRRARRCSPEALLSYLGEQEVKALCEQVGVEARGRKNALIERLLEAAEADDRASVQRYPEIEGNRVSPRAEVEDMGERPLFPPLRTLPDTPGGEIQFEPIKGYPMLNWRGKRPFTSTQHYPAQLKEVHGDEVGGWRNKIFWGDNVQVMSHLLKDFRGKVDLIYVDPPFDSKADYKKKIELKNRSATSDRSSFEEKQYSDIWANDEYIQYLYDRLVLLRELMSDRATIYVHMGIQASHYCRLICDEIFGKENFVTEVIWAYGTPSGGRAAGNKIIKAHEYILCYAKRYDSIVYNKEFIPYSEKYLSERFSFTDENGRRYRVRTRGQGVTERQYLDESPGVPLSTVWTDIKQTYAMHLVHRAQEELGYPTQKPEALLRRIISISSRPGDLVLDTFMGSGTTQAVAMKLGRRFIGADINLGAVQTTTKRIIKLVADAGDELGRQAGFEVYNVNNYDVFRNPVQAKELLIDAFEVQRIEFSSVFDGEKDGRMIKVMPVNRIATRADLNELIAGFDYRLWERRQTEKPNRPVEKITLICMGHEPALAAQLELAARPFKIDVEVVDILRDKSNLEFKRDSEAKVAVKNGELIIERFYPMSLLQKLSLQKSEVEDWRQLVDSILVDWNYDGAVLQPTVVDVPGKNEMVQGRYAVPKDAGTIRVKITDLLSESWEGEVNHG